MILPGKLKEAELLQIYCRQRDLEAVLPNIPISWEETRKGLLVIHWLICKIVIKTVMLLQLWLQAQPMAKAPLKLQAR